MAVASILLCTAVFLTVANAQGNRKCLNVLETNRDAFSPCLTRECFVLLQEPPFVILDESAIKSNPKLQGPFRCGDYSDHLSEFKGAFFEIACIMSIRDSFCVWGGHECTFDDLEEFVANHPSEHQFVAGGLLYTVPYRIRENSFFSSTILESKLSVVGPSSGEESANETWKLIWKPFAPGARWFLLACAVGHILARLGMAYTFADKTEGEVLRSTWARFKQFSPVENREKRTEEDEWWEWLNGVWLLVLNLFIAVTVLLWEVAIAVLVFEARTETSTAELKLSDFGMFGGTTQEFYLKKIFDVKPTNEVVWKQFRNQRAMYSALVNKTDEFKNTRLTLAYSTFNQYVFKVRPELCNTLRQYSTVPQKLVEGREPPEISGAWIFGRNVPRARQVVINREIVDKKDEIRRIVNSFTGDELPSRCTTSSRSIGFYLIAFLLGLIPGTVFLVWVLTMLRYLVCNYWQLGRNPQPEEEEEEEEQLRD